MCELKENAVNISKIIARLPHLPVSFRNPHPQIPASTQAAPTFVPSTDGRTIRDSSFPARSDVTDDTGLPSPALLSPLPKHLICAQLPGQSIHTAPGQEMAADHGAQHMCSTCKGAIQLSSHVHQTSVGLQLAGWEVQIVRGNFEMSSAYWLRDQELRSFGCLIAGMMEDRWTDEEILEGVKERQILIKNGQTAVIFGVNSLLGKIWKIEWGIWDQRLFIVIRTFCLKNSLLVCNRYFPVRFENSVSVT